MNILIIEDAATLRGALRDGLTKMGYAVDVAADGEEGLTYARFKAYDVIVLDLMLPKIDGLTVLSELRAAGQEAHVLILSAKDQVEDRVRGLQMGADDYMVKPFSFDELCARIGTLVRRHYQVKRPDIAMGDYTINIAARSVSVQGEAVTLTPSEYAILEYLVLNRGRVVTSERLSDAVHSCDDAASANVIPVMICTLRKKLHTAGGDAMIQTRRGYGYFIEEDSP
ncbi:MAG: response regulator transcription factor [Lentisphaerae bacterium]|nr:response regulator transcription factor [Lentisphaerota bacterium]